MDAIFGTIYISYIVYSHLRPAGPFYSRLYLCKKNEIKRRRKWAELCVVSFYENNS